ncbi:hypothetical protein PVAP13_5KG372600 [Panicum virgatum]|uniref:Secreted protein n=1 Tax=Panicum virgatum TaxID=38727 RepID=A0A8T0SI12_PANVG|nr:hypothetical protein PVAP13_5KG372600 [Panicum virgatum]
MVIQNKHTIQALAIFLVFLGRIATQGQGQASLAYPCEWSPHHQYCNPPWCYCCPTTNNRCFKSSQECWANCPRSRGSQQKRTSMLPST